MLITTNPEDIIQPFKKGAVIAYPTEAIYGLGCDPDNKKAVKRLLEIKQRPINKGLILVAADFSQVKKYLKPLSESQKKLTMPSATTYIFPALKSAPKWLTGDFDGLAIRISKHPLVQDLCRQLDSALVSTSANISGQTPAKTSEEVLANLGDKINVILRGKIGDSQKPSVIRDSISDQIIRS